MGRPLIYHLQTPSRTASSTARHLARCLVSMSRTGSWPTADMAERITTGRSGQPCLSTDRLGFPRGLCRNRKTGSFSESGIPIRHLSFPTTGPLPIALQNDAVQRTPAIRSKLLFSMVSRRPKVALDGSTIGSTRTTVASIFRSGMASETTVILSPGATVP